MAFLIGVAIFVGVMLIPLLVAMIFMSASFFNASVRNMTWQLLRGEAVIISSSTSLFEKPVSSVYLNGGNDHYVSYQRVGFAEFKVVQNSTEYSDEELTKLINSSYLIFYS